MVAEVAPRNIRSLGNRAGYRLLAIRDLGIPIWRVPVLCRVQERRPLPMLPEFHLRCLEAGLSGPDEIASFLNLPPAVARLTMAELLRDGYVQLQRNAKFAYELTTEGRELTKTWQETLATERVVSFDIDSLLQSPVHYPRELVTSSRQADLDGLLCLPTLAQGPPDLGPEDTVAFRRPYRLATNATTNLISLIQTEGNYETRYVKATGYLFESTDDDRELALRVVVDGRISEPHDTAVLANNLLQSLKVSAHVNEGRNQIDNVLGPEATAERVPDVEVASLLRDLDSASETDAGEDVSQAAREQTDKTEERLTELDVRRMSIREQIDLWPSATRLAKRSIMIISEHLDGEYWRTIVEPAIAESLEREVGVFIGYRTASFWSRANGKQEKVEEALRELTDRYGALSIQQLKRNGPNAIVIDNDTVILSKFSWLSPSGRYERRFADDRGTIVRKREFVADIVRKIQNVG